MSTGAEYRTSMRPAGAVVRRQHTPRRALPYAIPLAAMLAAMAAPGAAFAQNCTGPCLLDRLLPPIAAPSADLTNPAGKPPDRVGAPASWSARGPGLTGSTPRWTVSAEAIGLGRMGGFDQSLVARVPGLTQFLDTRDVAGAEALNSNQFNGFSAGPRISIIYHGDSGYGAELTYFNVFNQGATKAIGPDSPEDWLVMKAPGVFWQTQDFANQAMVWKSTTSLYSAEANGRLDLSSRVTVLAGVRWLQLNDNLVGDLTPPDQTKPTWKNTCTTLPLPPSPDCDIFHIIAGTTAAGNYPPFWVTSATNNLYGVQVGVDARLLEFGRFSLDGLVKAGVFDNHATQWTGVSMGKVVFPSQATSDHVAFASELGLQLKYQVVDGVAVKVGYKAVWLAGVALAPGQIQETFTTMSSVTALGVNCSSHALFQGATAGLEYSF